MKKTAFLFLVLLVFGFSFSAFAGFEGGEARITSMGGHVIVVPDASTTADLYSMGFSSAIFTRSKKSFISIVPGFNVFMKKTVRDNSDETTRDYNYFGGGNAMTDPSYQGAVLWLSNDTVVTVKPFVSGLFGEYARTYPANDSLDPYYEDRSFYMLGGTAEFSQKIGDLLAVSAFVGYLRKGFTESERDEYDNYSLYLDRLEYAVSAVMLSDSKSGLNLAINIGNKISLLNPNPFSVKYTVVSEEELELSMINGLFGYHSESEYESGANQYNSKTDIDTQGFAAEAGASFGGEGVDILSGKAGLIFGIKSTEKYVSKYTVIATGNEVITVDDTDTEIENGTGVTAEINARKDLGGMIAGVKGKMNSVFYKYAGSDTDRVLTTYNATAGICLGHGSGIALPVEVFINGYMANSKDEVYEYNGTGYEAGLRAGAELAVNDELAIRGGVDYGALGYYSVNKMNGEITSNSDAIGSQDNPYLMQLGVNAGAGLKLGGTELNIGARIEPFWESPSDEDNKSFNDMRITVKADVKIYI